MLLSAVGEFFWRYLRPCKLALGQSGGQLPAYADCCVLGETPIRLQSPESGMKGYTHGVTVAGISSALAAGWIRSRVRDEYNPDISPPSFRDRLQRRAPLAVAGLSFTGLSAIVSRRFDSYEGKLLEKESIPLDGITDGNHRDLHSIFILGGAYGAARLIKYAASKIAESTAGYLNFSDQSEAIIEALESIADWVLNSTAFGSLGHFAGDLPTKGDRGFAALKLLRPLSERNFSFGWIAHDAAPWNKYLQMAGLTVAGASWSVSGLYLLSWQPPEDRLTEYIQQLGRCEDYSEMKNQVLRDIEQLFTQLMDGTGRAFWNLPLFESAPADIRTSPEDHWYRMNYSLEEILGVKSADYETLVDLGILPQAFAPLGEGIPLQRSHAELQSDEIPLLDETNAGAESLSSNDPVIPTDSIGSDSTEDTEGLSSHDDDSIPLAGSEEDEEYNSGAPGDECLSDDSE